jgi:hypothetical protein
MKVENNGFLSILFDFLGHIEMSRDLELEASFELFFTSLDLVEAGGFVV